MDRCSKGSPVVETVRVPSVSSHKFRADLRLLGAGQLGSVVLVRPDGYVSMVKELAGFNGNELTRFFLAPQQICAIANASTYPVQS